MSEPAAPRHTLRNVILGLLAVLAISIALWSTSPPVPVVAGAAPSAPQPGALPVVAGLGGEFHLPSTLGRELSPADLRGRVVLLNFGFTSCPDVCPMVLTRVGHALRELADQGVDMGRVQPLFVTFDPERDSLDHLREYVTYFHPSLIALRGDAQQTQAITQLFKVIHVKQDSDSASGYVFQHSDYVYVLDTHGRVRLLVGSKDPEMAIVEAVKALLREADAK